MNSKHERRVEGMKNKIRYILEERDYRRKFQDQLTENLVFGCKDEYIGKMKLDKCPTTEEVYRMQPQYLSAMVKMMVAFIMSYVFNKIIDDVIEIVNEINPERNL